MIVSINLKSAPAHNQDRQHFYSTDPVGLVKATSKLSLLGTRAERGRRMRRWVQ